ncbi:MAG: hypothetical protein ACRD38_04445 [Nitrososphaerales archaeon]
MKKSGINSEKVKDYLDRTHELQVCRDLANGTKHLELDKPSRTKVFDWNKADMPWPVVRTYDPFSVASGYPQEGLAILVDGEELECNEFIKKCIEKWEDFLEKEKLPLVL